MKLEKNDTTRTAGIKLAIDWLKGIKMQIPYSRWVMFTIGVYILACAADHFGNAVKTLAPLLH